MDWITGIGKAVDYVEEHICERIDYEKAAEKACSSVFNFQRVFTAVCGFTLGEYIRMRRLSLAGQEIISTDRKIIDIALEYGYDSPESFSRAFTRFHGLSPAEARKKGRILSFSRISVNLTLIGGNTMDYRIEKLDALKIVCCRRKFTKPGDNYTNHEIPLFWNKCNSDGSNEKLAGFISENSKLNGLLGICFSADKADDDFYYGIGAEYDGKKDCGDFEIVEIPAYTYAVFTVKGKMPDAFYEVYRRICTEFFPQSDYEYGNGAEIEVYPSADTENPDYTCELWIAVKHK